MRQKVKLVNGRDDELWEYKFNLLKEYVETHNGEFPTRKVEIIGYWLDNQKRFLKNEKLPEYRKEKLDSLGNWTTAYAYENNWNCNFEELKKFIEENGRFPFQKENKLGIWLDHQKRRCKDDTKIEKLNSLGDWKPSTRVRKK